MLKSSGPASYDWLFYGYSHVLNLFIGNQQVEVSSHMKYLSDAVAFQFNCIIGFVDNPWIYVEGVYLDIVEVQSEK